MEKEIAEHSDDQQPGSSIKREKIRQEEGPHHDLASKNRRMRELEIG